MALLQIQGKLLICGEQNSGYIFLDNNFIPERFKLDETRWERCRRMINSN